MTAGDDPLWPRASDWLAAGEAAGAELVLMGLPTSSASITPSQAWRTPGALREVLARFATFDGEAGAPLDAVAAHDAGDLPLADLSPAEAVSAVEAAVSSLPAGPVYAFVGGDNVVTYPIVARHPSAAIGRMGVLTLDAHHDVRTYDGTPGNGAPIRALVDRGLPGRHVAQVGIHSFANSGAYRRWVDARGIQVTTMAEVDERGVATVIDEALDELADRCDAVHVDVDVDVLDRSFAPGCPGARPGGMTPRQLAAAVRRCGAHPAVASADFVEVDPSADVAQVTLMNLATAVLAFAAGIARRATETTGASR